MICTMLLPLNFTIERSLGIIHLAPEAGLLSLKSLSSKTSLSAVFHDKNHLSQRTALIVSKYLY